MAYNNVVEQILVTQSGASSPYISYLYGKITDKFSFLSTECRFQDDGERTTAVFASERKYCPYIRRYTEENIADVISIGYKYRFFAGALTLPLLTARERDILLTALVAADLPEDREYVKRQLKGSMEYCIDGLYNFRLSALKSRWQGIAGYVTADFNAVSLENFIDFLIGESRGKAFLKEGKLYDEEYRTMNKSELIGKSDPVREILLSGADNIYCFGEPDERTRAFLKKYYRGKCVFC